MKIIENETIINIKQESLLRRIGIALNTDYIGRCPKNITYSMVFYSFFNHFKIYIEKNKGFYRIYSNYGEIAYRVKKVKIKTDKHIISYTINKILKYMADNKIPDGYSCYPDII